MLWLNQNNKNFRIFETEIKLAKPEAENKRIRILLYQIVLIWAIVKQIETTLSSYCIYVYVMYIMFLYTKYDTVGFQLSKYDGTRGCLDKWNNPRLECTKF